MNDNTVVQMRYTSEQDMQYEESTIDDSSIQQTLYSTPSSDWSMQQNSYSSPVTYQKPNHKGSKKTKSEDDEDIDIDNFVHSDVQRIPVKTLRKIIPKMRIAVYCSDLLTTGKRKLKHLWDERPSDWPQNIPFKDPNNACKDVKKPGKDELGPMFNFLKEKYIQSQSSVSHHQQTATTFSESTFAYSHPVIPESSDDKDAAFYSSISSNPILPQIAYEHAGDQNNAFMISPKPEPAAFIDVSEMMKQERHSGPFATAPQMVSTALQGNAMSANISRPQPVIELFGRLEKKNLEVITLSHPENQNRVKEILRKVQQAVIRRLYDEITPTDTRICLMFLDAGHQMEALLDVMLVLRQVDQQLLDNGCHEIIKKFKCDQPQNVNYMLCDQSVPQLSGKNQLLENIHIPSGYNSISKLEEPLFGSKVANILADLHDDYDPYKIKAGGSFDHQNDITDSQVPLFKPRPGANGFVLGDSGLGIQKRVVVTAALSDMNIDQQLKNMVMVEKDDEKLKSSPKTRQQQIEEIMKILEDANNKGFSVNNQNPYSGETFSDEAVMSDDLLKDLNEIFGAEQCVDMASAEMTSGYMSSYQETGSCVNDQHSQLLPSGTSGVIPSMVEDQMGSDSETEDNPDTFMAFLQNRGTSGNTGFFPAKPFEHISAQWQPGGRYIP